MRLIKAHARLLAMNQPAFTTVDASVCLDIPRAYASTILARLSESGHVMSLRHGLWGFGDRVQALALPQYLTAPFPSYVSLQSALYYHGMISQIPAVTYAVSPARTRRYPTPLGSVSVHHISPAFFFGFEALGDEGAKLATPEKALLDVFYLSTAKTRLFRVLPEVEIPKKFSLSAARGMIRRIAAPQRRSMVNRLFEAMILR